MKATSQAQEVLEDKAQEDGEDAADAEDAVDAEDVEDAEDAKDVVDDDAETGEERGPPTTATPNSTPPTP